MFIEFPKGTVIEGVKEINEKDLVLKEDVRLVIDVKMWFEVDSKKLNLHLGDTDLDSLKEEILLDLKANYSLYTQHPDETLTEEAKKIKYMMLKTLEERDVDNGK